MDMDWAVDNARGGIDERKSLDFGAFCRIAPSYREKNSSYYKYFDDELLAKFFEEWNEQVKKDVPAERLLIHDARQGWEPLCAFLGKPIPDAPYPRVNDTASFRRHIHLVQAFLVVFYGGLVVAGGYVVRRLCR